MLLLKYYVHPKIINTLDELPDTVPEYGICVDPEMRLLQWCEIIEWAYMQTIPRRDREDLERGDWEG